MFSMKKILVHSVAWYLLCLMPENRFQNGLINLQIESYLKSELFGYMDRIKFFNKIMIARVRDTGENCHHWNIFQFKNMRILYLERQKWPCDVNSTDWRFWLYQPCRKYNWMLDIWLQWQNITLFHQIIPVYYLFFIWRLEWIICWIWIFLLFC